MFKKIISIILTVAVVCSLVVPAVYADEPDCLTNGHSFSDPPGIMKGFDGEIQGFPVKVSIKYCSKCKFYFHECNVLGIKLEYMSLTGFTGIDGELQAFLFTQIGRIMGSNASASQFQAGGGSASPGGVGRNPSGYAGEGVPSVNSTGVLCMVVEPLGMCSNWTNKGFYTNDNEKLIVGASSSGASYPSDDEVVVYKFVTPASGVYYIGNLNGSSYKYYRLNMSNYASSMCSLSHFNLLGYAAKDVTFPTPDPGGSGGGSGTTPTPTPAPTPDGPGGSGGGSGGNPLKWLAELLKDIVEGIFKAIWKLITSIFGFLIWLVSLLGKVLPFIPAEGLAALSAAAIIITVIRIIKFILGR